MLEKRIDMIHIVGKLLTAMVPLCSLSRSKLKKRVHFLETGLWDNTSGEFRNSDATALVA